MLKQLNHRTINSLFIILFVLAVIIFFISGCSTRNQPPQIAEDSTFVYTPKNPDDISVKITFCDRINKKTGEPVGEGTIFSIKDKAKLLAVIDLKNRKNYLSDDLMFHIDWTDEKGNSFYRKRIDLLANDSSVSISSSISITPDKRLAGKYFLRVYLFRELIAEKRFLLANEIIDSSLIIAEKISKSLKASITFCRRINSKTGKLIDAGKVFDIKDKASVFASISFEMDTITNQQLTFLAEWIGPNDSLFFRKKINITHNSKSFTISSSVSISPQKREPGNYSLKIYLLDKLLAENNFKLVKPEKVEKNIKPKFNKENISAQIILCIKISKKNGKPIGADSVFTIKDESKVFALINLEKRDSSSSGNIKLIIDWIGPNDSSFYRKKMDTTFTDTFTSIISSVSISPDKRKPGIYTLRIFISKELIAERKFELISQSN